MYTKCLHMYPHSPCIDTEQKLKIMCNIRRPLFVRGQQAVEHTFQVTFTTFNFSTSMVHWQLLFCNVPCCMLYTVSCIPPTVGSCVAQGSGFYHLLTRVAGFWVSLRRPWNSLKFQAITNASKNHENGRSRRPKASQMVSKEVPETIKLSKTWKS